MEPLLSRRSTYTLLILGFIVSATLFTLSAVQTRQDTRNRAAAATSLWLQADQDEITVGDDVTVSVVLDSGSNQVAAADINLLYDDAVFDAVSLEKADFLPSVLQGGTVGAGAAHIALGSDPAEPANGQGVVARFVLRATAPTNGTEVLFSNTTQVAAIGEDGNVVSSLEGTSIRINAENIGGVGTPETVLSIKPEAMTVLPGAKVYLPIQINTNGNATTAVDMAIVFDSNRFSGVSLTNGGFFPNTFSVGEIADGVGKIVVGSAPNDPKVGVGVVAVLELTAKDSLGASVVYLDNSTQVSGVSSTQNFVKYLQSSTITIANVVNPSPSPSTSTACSDPAGRPTGLSTRVVSGNQIGLSWDSVSNADYYGIVYGTQSGVYLYGAANVGNTTSYTVGGLTNGKTYYFAVFSGNECGASGYSAQVSGRPTSSTGTGGTGTPVATPKASTQPVSSFTPIDPNSNAGQFLSPKPDASPVDLPELTIPENFDETPVSSPFFTPLRIVIIGLLLLLLLGFILMRPRR